MELNNAFKGEKNDKSKLISDLEDRKRLNAISNKSKDYR